MHGSGPRAQPALPHRERARRREQVLRLQLEEGHLRLDAARHGRTHRSRRLPQEHLSGHRRRRRLRSRVGRRHEAVPEPRRRRAGPHAERRHARLPRRRAPAAAVEVRSAGGPQGPDRHSPPRRALADGARHADDAAPRDRARGSLPRLLVRQRLQLGPPLPRRVERAVRPASRGAAQHPHSVAEDVDVRARRRRSGHRHAPAGSAHREDRRRHQRHHRRTDADHAAEVRARLLPLAPRSLRPSLHVPGGSTHPREPPNRQGSQDEPQRRHHPVDRRHQGLQRRRHQCRPHHGRPGCGRRRAVRPPRRHRQAARGRRLQARRPLGRAQVVRPRHGDRQDRQAHQGHRRLHRHLREPLEGRRRRHRRGRHARGARLEDGARRAHAARDHGPRMAARARRRRIVSASGRSSRHRILVAHRRRLTRAVDHRQAPRHQGRSATPPGTSHPLRLRARRRRRRDRGRDPGRDPVHHRRRRAVREGGEEHIRLGRDRPRLGRRQLREHAHRALPARRQGLRGMDRRRRSRACRGRLGRDHRSRSEGRGGQRALCSSRADPRQGRQLARGRRFRLRLLDPRQHHDQRQRHARRCGRPRGARAHCSSSSLQPGLRPGLGPRRDAARRTPPDAVEARGHRARQRHGRRRDEPGLRVRK